VAKLETALKDAIARGARRQVRVVALPLRREVVRLRRKVIELHQTVASLRKNAAGWERAMGSVPPVPAVSEDEATSARLSPRLIHSLRRRLGLSQMGLARLVGVSAPAVAHWEAGDAAPAGANRATLVGLRKVGRRAVKELLARATKEPKDGKGARGVKTPKGRGGRRGAGKRLRAQRGGRRRTARRTLRKKPRQRPRKKARA